MPHFRVVVRGRNFWLTIDGRLGRMGFDATRFVEAADEEQAEDKALDMLQDDQTLHGAANEPGDPPEIFIEEIDEVAADKVLSGIGGYTFYPDEREPDA